MEKCMFSEIVKYLSIEDINSLSYVSKDQNSLCRENWLWNYLLERDFKMIVESNSYDEYIKQCKFKVLLTHNLGEIIVLLKTPKYSKYDTMKDLEYLCNKMLENMSFLYSMYKKEFYEFMDVKKDVNLINLCFSLCTLETTKIFNLQKEELKYMEIHLKKFIKEK